jgi:hypothetical protein
MGRPKKKDPRGGRREGAGRKPWSPDENPRNENVTFRVSARTLAQIRSLRDATREDEITFNELFIQWVDEMANDYGLE